MWLVSVRDTAIGGNIYECKIIGRPCNFPGSKRAISSKALGNGHLEDEYEYFPSVGRCRYFYEYEADTGLIVGFRFEESVQYACRMTGA